MSNGIEIKGAPGEHISQVAIRMRSAAPSWCEFNGARFEAHDGDTEGAIVAKWEAAFKANGDRYAASPEGIAAAKEAEDRRIAAQWTIDLAMRRLESVDWSDESGPLEWLCAMADAADHVGVEYDRAHVVDTFHAHGFEVGVYCGDAFDGSSRGIFARWIIGQALDGIKRVGSPHGMIARFPHVGHAKFGGVTA